MGMYSGKIITVRAVVDGRRRVKKLGWGEDVDLAKARSFARQISASHSTRAYLQAEPPMGSEALLVAAYEDGAAIRGDD